MYVKCVLKEFYEFAIFKKNQGYILVKNTEKPFACKVWPEGFTLASNLKIHQRTHTGEKLYTGKVCFKGFTIYLILKIHQRIHKNKP